jgi:hypothetical protein
MCKCELEFVGQLGSHPYHYIFTCKTHPHNFFSKEKEISECGRAAAQPEAQAGFWLCPNCHITNAGFRSVCSECETERNK